MENSHETDSGDSAEDFCIEPGHQAWRLINLLDLLACLVFSSLSRYFYDVVQPEGSMRFR